MEEPMDEIVKGDDEANEAEAVPETGKVIRYDVDGVRLDSRGIRYTPRDTRTKRTPQQRLYDRIDVTKMYLRGASMVSIAEWISDNRAYTLSESQIRYDLKRVKEEWVEDYLTNYDELKAKELANIDELQRSYWEAWEASRLPSVITEKEKIEDNQAYTKTGEVVPGYTRGRIKTTEKNQGGDPKYLAGIQWCIEQRCKILGFDAPKKYEMNWRKEAKAAGVNPDELEENLVSQFVEAARRGMVED